jgi:hypothetical protein
MPVRLGRRLAGAQAPPGGREACTRRADTTGTPSTTTLPQGTWAPWTATIGTTTTTTTPGLGRTLAAWSASKLTARRMGVRG